MLHICTQCAINALFSLGGFNHVSCSGQSLLWVSTTPPVIPSSCRAKKRTGSFRNVWMMPNRSCNKPCRGPKRCLRSKPSSHREWQHSTRCVCGGASYNYLWVAKVSHTSLSSFKMEILSQNSRIMSMQLLLDWTPAQRHNCMCVCVWVCVGGWACRQVQAWTYVIACVNLCDYMHEWHKTQDVKWQMNTKCLYQTEISKSNAYNLRWKRAESKHSQLFYPWAHNMSRTALLINSTFNCQPFL